MPLRVSAPGVDFPAAVADHLIELAERDPVRLAQITVLSNSARMQRRIRERLTAKGPILLPRMLLLTEIDRLLPPGHVPPVTPPLRRRLNLARLIQSLIKADPTLAPRSSAYDLADSLARLLDEMQGEAVAADALSTLEVADESGHWQRSVRFLEIAQSFLTAEETVTLDPEARLRFAQQELERLWSESQPPAPFVIAGSTGSRGTTSRLMKAVASLTNGHVLLPGYDMHMPNALVSSLAEGKFGEDHPQARLASALAAVDVAPGNVEPFGPAPPDAQRNALISLALRPAPVTDHWLSEGPSLGDLGPATEGMSLIEAASPRDEARSIALVVRAALEDGKVVAVVTPDRTLTRRVEAALARWGVQADESAGRPLSLSPPGRLLRMIAQSMGHPVSPEDLIALLTHPLASTGTDRGPHLLCSRELELALRRARVPEVASEFVRHLSDQPDAAWLEWVSDVIDRLRSPRGNALSDRMADLVSIAEFLAGGRAGDPPGALWDEAAGREAKDTIQVLTTDADAVDAISLADFRSLLDHVLQGRNVRDAVVTHPDVMIWGTLEARVQGAELVILSGLNEGIWPPEPGADPWLNRQLRKQAGLLLPDRAIGLSAHDFQQAVAAPEVVLTRARRDTEAETVPSRWLNRLKSLLSGLPAQNGDAALADMRARGDRWLAEAAILDRPASITQPAHRPSPAPPPAARPRKLSISDLETLIRDPYAIYAKRVLKLRALDALVPLPDTAVRGSALHKVMEQFVLALDDGRAELTAPSFITLAGRILDDIVPWPVMARAWTARLARIAPALIDGERARWAARSSGVVEVWGGFDVPGTEMHILGKADRIDVAEDGRLTIYDYKSGGPKQAKQIAYFDPQLPVEAVMAEAGGFEGLNAAAVAAIGHIGLSGKAETRLHEMIDGSDHDFRTSEVLAGLVRLLNRYADADQGFTARRAMERVRFEGDYDHLARAGEWDDTDPAVTEGVGS